MKNKQKTQNRNYDNPQIGSSGDFGKTLLTDLAKAGKVMDEMFGDLEVETKDFVGSLISGFHTIGDYFIEVLKLLGSFGGDSGAGDFLSGLLGFLPGGELLSGLIGLFSDVQPGAGINAHGGADEYLRQPNTFSPNITVVVNSEIESAKAVKFLTNYMPIYNVRNAGSAI